MYLDTLLQHLHRTWGDEETIMHLLCEIRVSIVGPPPRETKELHGASGTGQRDDMTSHQRFVTSEAWGTDFLAEANCCIGDQTLKSIQ